METQTQDSSRSATASGFVGSNIAEPQDGSPASATPHEDLVVVRPQFEDDGYCD